MTEGLSIFAVESPRALFKLAKLLEERRAWALTNLYNCRDWEGHVRIVGEIDGIDTAIQYIKDVEEQERN
jgi:hypothetical protein